MMLWAYAMVRYSSLSPSICLNIAVGYLHKPGEGKRCKKYCVCSAIYLLRLFYSMSSRHLNHRRDQSRGGGIRRVILGQAITSTRAAIRLEVHSRTVARLWSPILFRLKNRANSEASTSMMVSWGCADSDKTTTPAMPMLFLQSRQPALAMKRTEMATVHNSRMMIPADYRWVSRGVRP